MTGCSEFASRWSDRAGASIYEARRTFLTAVELEHVMAARASMLVHGTHRRRRGHRRWAGDSTHLVAAGAYRASVTTFATAAHIPSRLALAAPAVAIALLLAIPVIGSHARACQFNRAADLGAAHVWFKVVPLLPGVFVSIGTGDVEPHVREHGILEDALAVGVHDSEVVLRSGDTLIGGQSVSAHRFGFILGDAFASGVHAPEVEPRTHKALVRSYAIQAHRLVFILEDAFTVAGPGCRSAAA